jgi:glycosyltransferase involved in cell wall biosynthesis
MTAPSPHAGRQNGVLVCGPWPWPRFSVFEIVSSLLGVLNRSGRPVSYLCDGPGLREWLGPEALCLLSVPEDEAFDWRRAFCRKYVYPSLGALLADDRERTPSLLGRVGIIHAHQDQLLFGADHGDGHIPTEQLLADYIAERTGRRPLLVRTRHEDLEGNLNFLMQLTGVDYVDLDRPARETILRGEVDFAPVVAEHVARHRDLLHSWGYDDSVLEQAVHHVWWRLEQLRRWRHETTHFDAVVCLTRHEVDQTRDLLLCEHSRNLTWIHAAAKFETGGPERVARLLEEYRCHGGLSCYRGAGAGRELVAFTAEEPKVLLVGRSGRAKGCYDLVEALRNLYHSGRKTIRGLIVGHFDADSRRQLASSDPTHAGDYLFFTGQVWDTDVLAALYALADVTAIPSYQDSFALVGLESYQSGTPCVVTEGTGAGDVYLDNPRRHGVEIARPVRRRHRDGIARYYGVDVGSLAEQIAFLIDNPGSARQMAEDGRRFVQEHYSALRMGAKYLELYDRLLAGEQAEQFDP